MTEKTNTQTESLEGGYTKKYIYLVWVLIFLSGVILWSVGYRYEEFTFGKVMTMVGEFLSLVVALHAFYELFTKHAERKILQAELNNIVAPQREILDALKKNVADLDEHTKTVFNLVRYQDAEFFQVKWKYIAQKYSTLYIIGDFNISFLEGIKDKLQHEEKKLFIYLCAYLKNREDVLKILKFSEECISDIIVYHLDRFDWGFIALGTTKNETHADILLNYYSIAEDKMSGYHIEGETAVNLLKTLKSNFESKSNELSQDGKAWPLKINNRDVLDSIREIGKKYTRSINDLQKGTVLLGEDAICKKMSEVLALTQKRLKVTHIAINENIQLMESAEFQEWLQINYAAAANNVEIERILLLPRDEIGNEVIQRVVKKLKEHNIKVRYVILEDTDKEDKQDFSIYDDRHLIYINVESPEWKSGHKYNRAEARYSTDRVKIKDYNSIFSSLSSRAKEFPF